MPYHTDIDFECFHLNTTRCLKKDATHIMLISVAVYLLNNIARVYDKVTPDIQCTGKTYADFLFRLVCLQNNALESKN